MKAAFIALALCLPVVSLAAPAKTASKASSASKRNAGNPFTAERNKASSNLNTSIVMTQKLGLACKNQGGLSEEKIRESQNKWVGNNRPYLQMLSGYMSGYFATIKQFEGEDAAKKAVADMSKLFTDQASEVIKAYTDKNGLENTCTQYFQSLDSGKMDIKPGHPDYKTLNEMLEFAKKNAAATTK